MGSGLASGSLANTLTLVEMRGSSMSPEISTRGDMGSVCRVQRDVLRRVAVADDAAPAVCADRQLLVIDQAAELRWHGRHHRRVVAAACPDLVLRFRIDEAVTGEEVRSAVAADTGGREAGHLRCMPVGRADPQPAVPVCGQPVRQADVVGVHVGDDDPQHRQALELLCEDLCPGGAGILVRDATINHRPAVPPFLVTIAQQPQIDVIEGEGQGHAQPADAGCNIQRPASPWQGLRQRIAQIRLQAHVSDRVCHGWPAIVDDTGGHRQASGSSRDAGYRLNRAARTLFREIARPAGNYPGPGS